MMQWETDAMIHTNEMMKELLVNVLNRSLRVQGIKDMMVIGLSNDLLVAKVKHDNGFIGTVMAETILPESPVIVH